MPTRLNKRFFAIAYVGQNRYERELESWELNTWAANLFPKPVNGRFAPESDYADWADGRMPKQ